jgi:hypothetical protein
MRFRDIPIEALTLDQAIRRMKEIVKMDFQAMAPADRVNIVFEAYEINAKFKVVDHDCELDTLLDALEALKADLEV